MADKTERKKKTVEGVQLESLGHGVWHVVGAPKADLFMRHGPVQMGLSGRRYTLNRWTTPAMVVEGAVQTRNDRPTYGSLRQAVRVWKAWKEQCEEGATNE